MDDIKLKVIYYVGDYDACRLYRVKVPNDALKAYGVYTSEYCFIPSHPEIEQTEVLIGMISHFDLVVVQRCHVLEFVQKVKHACEFLGKPFVLEFDDDYFNIPADNPAYLSVVEDQDLFKRFLLLRKAGKVEEAQELIPALLKSREKGLENYKIALSLADYVTVSTEELKRTIYPYNKNVVVFENMIDRVFPWRSALPVQACYETDDDGKTVIKLPENHGLYRVPSYDIHKDRKSYSEVVRIGYTGTESHRGSDFNTILPGLNEFCKRNKQGYYFSFLGDPYFMHQLEDKSRAFSMPPCPYDTYMMNINNMDIMLCPLAPNMFNMSKSDIKLVEAGAWGIPGLAPRYITYSRNWVDEETCLMYTNAEEFVYQLERLVKDHALRRRLGRNALEYVATKRLAHLHSRERFEFYSKLVKEKKTLSFFKPNKETVNA